MSQVLDDTNRQLRGERTARHAVNMTVTSLQLQLDQARDEIRWQGARLLASLCNRSPAVQSAQLLLPDIIRMDRGCIFCIFAGDQRAVQCRRAVAGRDSRPAIRRSLDDDALQVKLRLPGVH